MSENFEISNENLRLMVTRWNDGDVRIELADKIDIRITITIPADKISSFILDVRDHIEQKQTGKLHFTNYQNCGIVNVAFFNYYADFNQCDEYDLIHFCVPINFIKALLEFLVII